MHKFSFPAFALNVFLVFLPEKRNPFTLRSPGEMVFDL